VFRKNQLVGKAWCREVTIIIKNKERGCLQVAGKLKAAVSPRLPGAASSQGA